MTRMTTAQRVIFTAAGIVIVALTGAAFWLSYAHLALDVAGAHGLSGARMWAWPATLDAFIIAGELLMLLAALRGQRDPWAIGLTVVGSGGSIALNVAGVISKETPFLDYVVAGVPPTAALLAFGALMRQIHQVLSGHEADTATTPVPGGVGPPGTPPTRSGPETAATGTPPAGVPAPEPANGHTPYPVPATLPTNGDTPSAGAAPLASAVPAEPVRAYSSPLVNETPARLGAGADPAPQAPENGAEAPTGTDETVRAALLDDRAAVLARKEPEAGVLAAVKGPTRAEVRAEYTPDPEPGTVPADGAEAAPQDAADEDERVHPAPGVPDDETHPGTGVPAVPEEPSTPQHPLPGAVSDTAEDELTARARVRFSDVLEQGRTPSVRQLRGAYGIGQARAQRIRDELKGAIKR